MTITLPFYRFHRTLFTGMSAALQERHGITTTELDVLAVLYAAQDHTLSPTHLYQRLLFSSGGMTKLLKKLEEKAYVERLENIADKRSMLVRLTASGTELMQQALQTALTHETACLAQLDETEREQFRELLEKLEGC